MDLSAKFLKIFFADFNPEIFLWIEIFSPCADPRIRVA
jgi:hypothetical protein